ncbi:choice-of-anchor U domain-containing protein [Verminephrobacter aporrectodeae]|uniref:choice-of-anchor U domain-containing protein n=1 Tax=Verminephrobacter aporrectodeae TaxID=1110389 RepID=UPI002AA2AB5A|nr:choice-of-anchor U domain-containing protein [Verminephrobacter aporrectodeae]
MEMPLGLLRFEATLAPGHSSEAFSLYVDPALGVGGYWARDGTGTWVNLSSAPCGGQVASKGGRLRLDFEIADGGPFDADGQANGVITAPGAAARMPLVPHGADAGRGRRPLVLTGQRQRLAQRLPKPIRPGDVSMGSRREHRLRPVLRRHRTVAHGRRTGTVEKN